MIFDYLILVQTWSVFNIKMTNTCYLNIHCNF